MAVKKPSTQREMVEQLWYAMIGTNGDGALEQLSILNKSFTEFMRTRSETCPVRVERQRRGVLPATWIMFAVATASLITTWIIFGVRL